MESTMQSIGFDYFSSARVFRRAGVLSPLVSADTEGQFIGLAEGFPIPVQTACYECRLAADDCRVDLALCVFPEFLESPLASQALDELERRYSSISAWRATSAFLRGWSSGKSVFRDAIPFVWLAFDLDPADRELPSPCIGLCIEPEFFARRLGAKLKAVGADECERLADECSRAFRDHPLKPGTKRLIQRILGNQDLSVEPTHLSFMLARETFKLDVRLPIEKVGAFLDRIEWPGPSEKIQERIVELAPWSGHVQLNLVLEPGLVGPLEVEFMNTPDEVTDAGRLEFLDRLVALDLCAAGKAAALSHVWNQPWGNAADADDPLRVARGWYVKVRFQEATPIEAKAYVGLMPRTTASLLDDGPEMRLAFANAVCDHFRDEDRITDHPFLRRMRAEATDLGVLWTLLANFQISISRNFARYLASVTSRVTDERMRCILAEQLSDELGHGDFDRAHTNLFSQMMALLEPWRPQGGSVATLTPGHDAIDHLDQVYGATDINEAIGAVIAGELIAEQLDHFLAEEFRRQETIDPARLDWLTTHVDLEVTHARASVELASLMTPDTHAAVVRGARRLFREGWAFLDGVYADCYDRPVRGLS